MSTGWERGSTMAPEEKEVTRFETPDGQYRIRFHTDEHGILFVEATGYEDFESSKRIVSKLREHYEKLGTRFKACLDATGYEGLAPESRKYMRDSLLQKDSVFERFAVIGGNLFTRNLFNLYTRVAKIPMRVFKTREAAVDWLLEA
jgi:hypothetical protein